MSGLEDRIREMMNARSSSTAPPPPPIGEALSAGRAARFRRRVLVSAAAMAGVAAIAGGSVAVVALTSSEQPSEEVAERPTAKPSHTKDEQEPSDTTGSGYHLGPVTRCADLPPIPSNISMDTTLAWEIRQVRFSYTDPSSAKGAQRTFVVDFGADLTCRSRADALRVINHALEAGGHPTIGPQAES